MDIARPDIARKKRRRRILYSATAVVIVAAITVGLSRLQPAAPSVEKNSVLADTVKRGQMLRQVRGNGSLVPEQIQYVQAETEGRVERILVLPGTEVKADTLLIELSNPQLKQEAFQAEWQLKADEALLTKLNVQLESERLTQKSEVASLKSEYEQAELFAQANENLSRTGLVATLTARQTRAKANDLKARWEIEEERLKISENSASAQVAGQQAAIEKDRALLTLKRAQVEALQVRAHTDGVLQQIGDTAPLQVGQRVTPAATLAKIVQPNRLKAEIKIAETQAKDVVIGQTAEIDTHSMGVLPGTVVRVDPAVQNGTVTVDIRLESDLPKGARPDQSVDGTIELERLDDVVYVGRPVQSQAESTIGLFKVIDQGRGAVRVSVKLGRSSVSTIQVLEGLQPGDQVILSDMSAWDSHERIRLN